MNEKTQKRVAQLLSEIMAVYTDINSAINDSREMVDSSAIKPNYRKNDN